MPFPSSLLRKGYMSRKRILQKRIFLATKGETQACSHDITKRYIQRTYAIKLKATEGQHANTRSKVCLPPILLLNSLTIHSFLTHTFTHIPKVSACLDFSQLFWPLHASNTFSVSTPPLRLHTTALCKKDMLPVYALLMATPLTCYVSSTALFLIFVHIFLLLSLPGLSLIIFPFLIPCLQLTFLKLVHCTCLMQSYDYKFPPLTCFLTSYCSFCSLIGFLLLSSY